MSRNGSYRICCLDRDASCKTCEIRDKLNCEPGKVSNTKRFYSALLALVLSSFGGLGVTAYFTGVWWPIPVLFVFWMVYQFYTELIVHCPHCPFWDESSEHISCGVNCGIPKPKWKWIQKYLIYKPEPYSPSEKWVLNVSNNTSILFPLLVMGYGLMMTRHPLMIGAVVFYILSSGVFSVVLFRHYCSRCVNVSCVLNRVSDDVVQAFLDKNPYIKQARDQDRRGGM